MWHTREGDVGATDAVSFTPCDRFVVPASVAVTLEAVVYTELVVDEVGADVGADVREIGADKSREVLLPSS